jgi:glucose-6-phosphate 1-dehydrogenase
MTESKNEAIKQSGAVFFIFGATGDLARRKLFPAIYSLYREGKLSEKFAVIGLARRSRTEVQFHDDLLQSIQEFARYKVDTPDADWKRFAEHFTYMSLDINNIEGFKELSGAASKLEQKFEIAGNRLFYLALAPDLFGSVAHNLRDGGLLDTNGWHRSCFC